MGKEKMQNERKPSYPKIYILQFSIFLDFEPFRIIRKCIADFIKKKQKKTVTSLMFVNPRE